ncbi:MAG: thioesterase family protein [Pseudanabaenaceae cyanobacterium SKYGB_i_bin29]|nr:acyl-CoA thioesterase [Pseudanabaenaceae cyanobacterium SKYG29]MDW8421732.1 thioesterase family protein [Pseudanabaenaceae cyanobacterium SKYGB_i_bin29]
MGFICYRRVYFADTDGAGVVYFAHVLAFCHSAYEESLRTRGVNMVEFFTGESLAFPITNCEMSFVRPILCGDLLTIELTGKPEGFAEFVTFYQVKVGEELKAQGSLRHCCIDRANRQRSPLPPYILDWLASLGVPEMFNSSGSH